MVQFLCIYTQYPIVSELTILFASIYHIPYVAGCRLQARISAIAIRWPTHNPGHTMQAPAIKDKLEKAQLLKVAQFDKEKKTARTNTTTTLKSFTSVQAATGFNWYHGLPGKTAILFSVKRGQVHYRDLETMPEGCVFIVRKVFIDACLDGELKKLLAEISAHTCLMMEGMACPGQLIPLLVEAPATEGLMAKNGGRPDENPAGGIAALVST